MPFIFVAWPLAGATWIFLGEAFVDNIRILVVTCRATRSQCRPAQAALVLFGAFFVLIALQVPAALRSGSRACRRCCSSSGCRPGALQRNLQVLQLFHPAGEVPFFLLTANLMNIGGITDRLVHLAHDGRQLARSLAQINVLLSVFFAGISSSPRPDAASEEDLHRGADQGRLRPVVLDRDHRSVGGARRSSASILMIVWGGVLSVSIGALYLAGILPGLLIAAAQMATVHVYAKIYHYPVYPRATLRESSAPRRSRCRR